MTRDERKQGVRRNRQAQPEPPQGVYTIDVFDIYVYNIGVFNIACTMLFSLKGGDPKLAPSLFSIYFRGGEGREET